MNKDMEKTKFDKLLDKISEFDEYGQLHEQECVVNSQDPDACDCAMATLIKEAKGYMAEARACGFEEAGQAMERFIRVHKKK